MKQQFLKFYSAQTAFRCPICHSSVQFTESGSFICKNGHCFDTSSKGNVNFIPRQKPMKGYDEEFFKSRQKFLDEGFYDHILKEIINVLPENSPQKMIVDAGCGEGFYAAELKRRVDPSFNIFAFDISKEAIKIAVQRDSNVLWTTSDLSNIPLKKNTAACILNIFSPANYREFRRILTKDGLLIKAVPGSLHLQELRRAVKGCLRSEAVPESQGDQNQSADYFIEKYECLHRIDACKTYAVTGAQVELLTEMTPLFFSIKKNSVDLSDVKNITIHAEILVGRPRFLNHGSSAT